MFFIGEREKLLCKKNFDLLPPVRALTGIEFVTWVCALTQNRTRYSFVCG